MLTWLVGMKQHFDNHQIFVDSSPALAGCSKDQLGSCQGCWHSHSTWSWSQMGYRVRRAAAAAAGVRGAGGRR